MRIGIFTDAYPPYINGVATSVVMLENALRKQGHKVFIITVNAENYKYHYENDNEIIRVPGILTGIYDFRFTSIYPIRIINKIKKMNLDVIHSQTEFGIGTFARIIAKQFNIPIVHTYHTAYEDYVHYITHGHFNKPSKKIVEYLTKFYCDKTVSELIVPTKKMYNFFKAKYKYDRNIYIIPTGIDTSRFYREQFKDKDIDILRESFGLSKDDFVIMFVGRIGKEKNINLLIEAHKDIVKHNKNAKLMIIGSGPDEDVCYKLVEKEHLEDNVLMIGKVPFVEIPKYYSLASVFATASKTETQGLTVIEAMAASVPVVAIYDDSFKEFVINDLNGYLFKNKKEYVRIIDELIKNPNKRKQLGSQARISSDNYSDKMFADRVMKVYESAVVANGSSSKTFFGRAKNVFKKGFKS